jgi:hypothetical protein
LALVLAAVAFVGAIGCGEGRSGGPYADRRACEMIERAVERGRPLEELGPGKPDPIILEGMEVTGAQLLPVVPEEELRNMPVEPNEPRPSSKHPTLLVTLRVDDDLEDVANEYEAALARAGWRPERTIALRSGGRLVAAGFTYVGDGGQFPTGGATFASCPGGNVALISQDQTG